MPKNTSTSQLLLANLFWRKRPFCASRPFARCAENDDNSAHFRQVATEVNEIFFEIGEKITEGDFVNLASGIWHLASGIRETILNRSKVDNRYIPAIYTRSLYTRTYSYYDIFANDKIMRTNIVFIYEIFIIVCLKNYNVISILAQIRLPTAAATFKCCRLPLRKNRVQVGTYVPI